MPSAEFFENVFEDKFCRFLLRESLVILHSNQLVWTTNLRWDPKVVKASAPVLVRPYNDLLKDKILNQLLKKEIIKHKEYDVMNYVWTRLSYIPWHNDGHVRSAITIYLNENWHKDWGGIFLFMEKESEQIKGYIPKFNSAVRNESGIMHSTTIISSDAEAPRITIQLFSALSMSGSAAT
jgi:hypothetical protein